MKKKDLLSVLLIPIGLFLMATVPVCSQSQPHHAQAAHSGAIALGPGVTIFESSDEPSPIQQATEDLANDFEKVFGTRPRIVHREQDAALVTLVIGEQSKIPEEIGRAHV